MLTAFGKAFQVIRAVESTGIESISGAACLFVVLDEELARLELVGVHDIQQLSPRSVLLLQVLPVELLHTAQGWLRHGVHAGDARFR